MRLENKYRKTLAVWRAMRTRCTNPSRKDFIYYGGRGIQVCERWANFMDFLSDMGPCPEGLTLERINNDGDYSPSNCKWASWKEQNRNKRTTGKLIKFNGKTMSITAWAQELHIKPNTLTRRFLAGWSAKRALAFPIVDGRLGNQNARRK